MDLAGLRTFLTVAAERSFSRAATKLHRSQPAVSLAIRRLELELGEPLFDRRGRGGKLTEAGEVLQVHGPRVLRLIEEITAAVRNARQVRRSTLTIGAEEWMLASLGPLLAAFREAHQDVRVDLRIQEPSRKMGSLSASTDEAEASHDTQDRAEGAEDGIAAGNSTLGRPAGGSVRVHGVPAVDYEDDGYADSGRVARVGGRQPDGRASADRDGVRARARA